jgi:hypothetical protein
MPDKFKLNSADEQLINSAKTGDGLVEITPEMAQQMSNSIQNRMSDIAARYPKLVEDCDYETKLAVAAWVFGHIVDHATEGGSFRYLIYDRLGFGPDAYIPLYNAGGMTISNEFELNPEGPNT